MVEEVVPAQINNEDLSAYDGTAYEAYVSILEVITNLQVKVDEAVELEKWFEERQREAKGELEQIYISAKMSKLSKPRVSADELILPEVPSQSIVEQELGKIRRAQGEINSTNGQISRCEGEIAEKQKEITKRNTVLAVLVVIYIVGIPIAYRITGQVAAALAWPALCMVGLLFFGVLAGLGALAGGGKK